MGGGGGEGQDALYGDSAADRQYGVTARRTCIQVGRRVLCDI
jgi:hypothetical protein